MNVAVYWPMVREYSIWNTTIPSLQFWTVDLDSVTLGSAMEEVYSAFFYSTSSHTLFQQPDKILFGHFMITLNAPFNWQLALADEGYESSSDTTNVCTPLRKMQESTIFPASNMLHLILIQSHQETCYKLHQDQYADDCHSVHQIMTTPQETSCQLLEQHQQVLKYT